MAEGRDVQSWQKVDVAEMAWEPKGPLKNFKLNLKFE